MDDVVRGNRSNAFYFVLGDKWYYIKDGEIFEIQRRKRKKNEDFRNHQRITKSQKNHSDAKS